MRAAQSAYTSLPPTLSSLITMGSSNSAMGNYSQTMYVYGEGEVNSQTVFVNTVLYLIVELCYVEHYELDIIVFLVSFNVRTFALS